VGRIEWDQAGDRIYETGLDRGVLYLEDGTGVPWNGLVSFDDALSSSGSDVFVFDGNIFANLPTSGDFSGKIQALTYPDEFLEYDGYVEVEPGLFADNQNRKPFSLSFRTLVGDDVSDLALGYKIHILYNLTAAPQPVANKTADSNVSPMDFVWSLTSVPETVTGYAPTAYVIFDSRYLDPIVLEQLEDALYGTDVSPPELPSLEELVPLGFLIVITDNGDGTWTATGPDSLVVDNGDGTFQIDEVNMVWVSEPDGLYSVSST
jgi:hypothetical protein